ncbi:hypothetical protein C0992_000054 [Termitomyces sp. T32_za158]|nr:hypothetical protein C0992_000054 [Termitomyces sp. T32_za158]
MPAHEGEDDFQPSATPGAEYAKLDAEDESLARWKASLGIVPGATGNDTDGPKVTILTLELDSPTLPVGKKIILDLMDAARLAEAKKNPIVIKEGVEYNVRITFKVNHSIISGVRYMQVVKRAGVKVDKLEQMLGSYGPHPNGEAYAKNFDTEESPSGLLARSGSYNVRSRVVDDDGEVYADWEWSFKLAKECSVPAPTSWVDRLPQKVRPYLYLTRIDKPIGTLLLFYPCAWSITMASYALQLPFTTPLTYIGLFGLGAVVMRGAGCTINDMWDKNLDKAVGEFK